MITVTNSRVAGFEPRWASFRGFSLLFDNPGDSVSPMGSVLKLDTPVETGGDLALYRTFAVAIDKFGRDLLINTYLFCPLAPYSYHVTAWDGVNDGNLAAVTQAMQPELQGLLQDFPDRLTQPASFLPAIDGAALATRRWSIRFKFERLAIWGNIAALVLVEPADEESVAQFEQICLARTALSDTIFEQLGVRPYANYTPHVTLGYFANRELAELAQARLPYWHETLAQMTEGLAITFETISLYGFTDLITFFKRPA
jgi:hypothetical protein